MILVGRETVSHFLCPPVITILPIIGKSLDDLHFGTLAPIIVPNVGLFFGVADKLELLFGEGEKVVVYV